MSTLLLIDGNNLFHRAYHALPPLSDKTGENANAVYGFSNMLLKAIDEVKPDYVACAFDTKAPTFRHIEFEKYKAQRPAPPPDLYPQLPKVKRVLSAFSIPIFEKEGYEADDLLATIAVKIAGPVNSFPPASARSSVVRTKPKQSMAELRAVGSPSSVATRNFEVVILSGDRDVLQLVDGYIKVQMPGWNLNGTTLYGAKEVKEKFGIEPVQMVDYKSLIGDISDNVPGIAGIGPKTAASLLQKYHTLENLFEHINEQGETVRAKLVAGKDLALAAKRLVELDLNVDLPHSTSSGSSRFTINDLRFEPEWEKVREEYERLGFKSIVAKLPGAKNTSEVSQGATLHTSEVEKDEKRNHNDQLKLI